MSVSMMLFDYSSLAEAAYSDFIDPRTGNVEIDIERIQDALLGKDGKKFSPSQAQDFLTRWELIHHLPNQPSGFSATLFRSVEEPGRYVLSMRGTEPAAQGFQDLRADVGDLILDGAAHEQIIDMANYFRWLSTSVGASYSVAKSTSLGLTSLSSVQVNSNIYVDQGGLPLGIGKTIGFEDSSSFYDDDRSSGLGLLNHTGQLDVAGHSLGGHLAMAFTRLFPETGAMAITINGAGFREDDLQGINKDNFLNLLAGRATNFDQEKILNLFGSAGPNVVTQDWGVGLSQPGEHLEVFTEAADIEAVLGHSGSQMTDSLAVQHLLTRIDSSISLETVNAILESTAGSSERTLEGMLESLSVLLKVSDEPVASDDREALHRRIAQINTKLDTLGSSETRLILNLSEYDAATLAAQAKRSIGVRSCIAISAKPVQRLAGTRYTNGRN